MIITISTWSNIQLRDLQCGSAPGTSDRFECSNVNKMSDQHMWSCLWGPTNVTLFQLFQWYEVSQTFLADLVECDCMSSVWIHAIFMNLLLKSLIMFIKDILRPMFICSILRKVQETLFKKAGHWIISTQQWVVLLACCCCLQHKQVRCLQLRENMMWIKLIGLLSGVIAVCGLGEHLGNDVPTASAAEPLDLWVITVSLLTQDTHTKPYECTHEHVVDNRQADCFVLA